MGDTSSAENGTETTYNIQAATHGYVNHIQTSITPSSTGSRVMVVAQFDFRRAGGQSNTRFAYARLAASNGSLLNTNVVGTNENTYEDTTNNFGTNTSQFTLIGYDYAQNTSTRTYYIQVYGPWGTTYAPKIRNAAIWAIEFSV